MKDFLLYFFDQFVSLKLSSKQEYLILSDCGITIDNKPIFSQIDELNFCLFNSNNNCGHVLIELMFERINIPYSLFYMGCLTLRTDNGFLLKLNQPLNIKETAYKNYTKVNKMGKIVIGAEYFFRSKNEREIFSTCQSLYLDGFLALKKKNNTYGFSCKVIQKDNAWQFIEGNTYRIYKLTNIKKLWH